MADMVDDLLFNSSTTSGTYVRLLALVNKPYGIIALTAELKEDRHAVQIALYVEKCCGTAGGGVAQCLIDVGTPRRLGLLVLP